MHLPLFKVTHTPFQKGRNVYHFQVHVFLIHMSRADKKMSALI